MMKEYFWYAEVFVMGTNNEPVWVGDGIVTSNKTASDVRTGIGQNVKKHVTSITSQNEVNLNVVVKQFNTL